jgi:chromate reductase
MADPLRILEIVGSLRTGSLNRALLRAAVDLAPAGMTIDIFGRSTMATSRRSANRRAP